MKYTTIQATNPLNSCFNAAHGNARNNVETESQLSRHFAVRSSKTRRLGGGDKCFFLPIQLNRKAQFTNAI